MPIMYKHLVRREDAMRNPRVLFLYGDNEERSGYGGLARHLRDEPNGVGIRTKAFPSMVYEAFWTDSDFDRVRLMIDEDFAPVIQHLEDGGIVVLPANGLATGTSLLMSKAPRIYSYIKDLIETLENRFPHPPIPKKEVR